MNLHPVRARFNRIPRSLREPLDVLLDLVLRKLARCLVLLLGLDGRGGDVGVAFSGEDGGVGGAAGGPELKKEKATLSVHGIDDLSAKSNVHNIFLSGNGKVWERTSFHAAICASL